MATVDDVEVANASFPNVRQDLNDILEALATNFSADAEPTTTYPNQFWYETDTNLLYIRNEADDAWITLASINQTSGEWEPRTAVIQAVDSAGLALKTDEGTTRFSISDAGVVSFENYAFPSADGSNGQVLTTDGSGTLTFEDGGAGDKIEEGNSSVEVVDTGTGRIEFTTDGSEAARIDSSGRVLVNSTSNTTALVNVDTDGSNNSSGYGICLKNVAGGGSTWTMQCGDYAVNNGTFTIRNGGAGGTTALALATNGYLKCAGVYNQSAADSANVVVDSSGNIYRSTSALKYKQNVRDLESIDISSFRPVRYKSNIERDDQTLDHFGFIADEFHDAGLTELVSYGAVDEETGVAEVEGFRYDRMTVVLTKALQEANAKISALESRIEALENQ